MEKLKAFGGRFKFEITALAAFSVIYIVNLNSIGIQNGFIIAAQFIFASLFAGRFVKSFADEGKKNAGFFAACFVILFMAAYNYSLFSIATVDVKHSACLALYVVAMLCLADKSFAFLALIFGAAGVSISMDFAVMCLPSMIVSAAFAHGGFFTAKQEKKKNSKKNAGYADALAERNRFLAPALLAVAAVTAIAYFVKGNPGYGLFLADIGYLKMNFKYLHPLVPTLIIVVCVWIKALKNKKSLTAFICVIAAAVITVVSSCLFDFSLVLFKLYVLCAVGGLFGSTMVISARSQSNEDEPKASVSALSPAVIRCFIVIMLLYLPLVHSYLVK